MVYASGKRSSWVGRCAYSARSACNSEALISCMFLAFLASSYSLASYWLASGRHKDMSCSESDNVHKFFYNFMIANHMIMRQNKNMLNASVRTYQCAFLKP